MEKELNRVEEIPIEEVEDYTSDLDFEDFFSESEEESN